MDTVDYDVALFESIAALLNEQRHTIGRERRDNDRHAYECIQLLAPYSGGAWPQQQDFRQVLCQDLSPKGFRFRSYRKGESPQVVVALGSIPFKFFLADIMHAKAVRADGDDEFQIGCQFVRRIG